jgi:hypothetical protein
MAKQARRRIEMAIEQIEADELERLRADAKRLDWMDCHHWIAVHPFCRGFSGTIRETIDRAMETRKP